MPPLATLNLASWIEENRHLLKPPVGNKRIFPRGEFIVMAVGGLVYRMGIRKLQGPALGRVKVSPSLGGVVLSGRF